MFLIGGYMKGKEPYIGQGAEGVHFVFCYACNSGNIGTLPPWHPHIPSTWECFDCGAKFSVHKVTEE
jgi:hypothetical protein